MLRARLHEEGGPWIFQAVRPFSLRTEEKEGATVVHLEGELDLAAVPKLQKALHPAQHAACCTRRRVFMPTLRSCSLTAASSSTDDVRMCGLMERRERTASSAAALFADSATPSARPASLHHAPHPGFSTFRESGSRWDCDLCRRQVGGLTLT